MLILHGFPRHENAPGIRVADRVIALALPWRETSKSWRPAAESDFALAETAITCSSCSRSRGRMFCLSAQQHRKRGGRTPASYSADGLSHLLRFPE
ncbi:hypothetical protein ACVXHB_06890 [Escherichia coli]